MLENTVLSMAFKRVSDYKLELNLKNFIAFKPTGQECRILENSINGSFAWNQICKNSSLTVNISDDILSEANKENCLKLLNSEKSKAFFQSKSLKKAAVLVPLCKHNDELALLYTVRALHLKVNGGEIAFPGGKFDESDRTLENTALREAYEEIGIHPKKVEIWGKGPEIHRPDIKITPVLAYIGQLHLEELKINHNEVSCVFSATLEQLSSYENFRFTKFRTGKTYIFQTPVYLRTGKRIWGLTAYITHMVLSGLIPNIYKTKIKFKPTVERVLHNYKNKQ